MRVSHKWCALWSVMTLAAFSPVLVVFSDAKARRLGTIDVVLDHGKSPAESTTPVAYCKNFLPSQKSVGAWFGRNVDGIFVLGFFNSTWRLIQGTVIPINLTLDGQFAYHLLGTVTDPSLISTPLPPEALIRLRESSLLVASARSQTFSFVLTPAKKVVQSIGRCLESIESGRTPEFELALFRRTTFLCPRFRRRPYFPTRPQATNLH
jgi:hypothetical protein